MFLLTHQIFAKIVDSFGPSNAKFQPPLEAGARQERTLSAVGCKPLFGQAPA